MKKIKFVAKQGIENIIPPAPIKSFIPEWYKVGETYDENDSPALKTCIPFLDVMLAGYVLTTLEDMQVITENEKLIIQDGKIKEDGTFEAYAKNKHSHNHKHDEDDDSIVTSSFVNERKSKSGSTIPRPAGHMHNHLVWSGKWGWKVPRGYSVIVTHPFNRHDLPFTTLSGIIDSDGWVPSGNIPFFIKKDFNGIIPKGTPVAQLFPYKRDSWQMSISKILQSRQYFDGTQNDRSKIGYYKRKYWNRKNYN
jgi:hypothetical protein